MSRRSLVAACFAAASLLTAADPPKPRPAPKLEVDLKAILARPLAARSITGVHVVELKTGKVLFAHNENRLMLPASNMKLATTAAALTRLGPDYRFTTRILRERSGDLVLVGGGDPALSFRKYPYQKDSPALEPLHALQELADQAIAAGLTSVVGDIVGDDTAYPYEPYPPTWTHEDTLNNDGAPVSALTLNDNVIAITVRAGEHAGDLARLDLNPPVEYFVIDNRVTTSAGPARVHVGRRAGTNQILLWGSVPLKGASALFMPVDDPALFAAQALYDILESRGISIRGRPVARHRYMGEDESIHEGEVLAKRTSPPLSELLQVVDKVSQNLHAELMLREVGRVARKSGTREAGIAELSSMLTTAGASPDEFRLEDGSGLSRNAQLTPRVLTRVLASMWQTKDWDTWLSLLPVGGEDGTLSNRLCCTSGAHSIHAKTGSLARAVALSGYADSKTHGMLAFSILVNNFSAPATEVRAWVDKMALALVE